MITASYVKNAAGAVTFVSFSKYLDELTYNKPPADGS